MADLSSHGQVQSQSVRRHKNALRKGNKDGKRDNGTRLTTYGIQVFRRLLSLKPQAVTYQSLLIKPLRKKTNQGVRQKCIYRDICEAFCKLNMNAGRILLRGILTTFVYFQKANYYLIVFIKVQLAVDLSSHEDITAKLAAQLVRLFPVKQHLQHHQNQNMPYSCRTMSPILLQTINIFIATYLFSSGMGRCALTRFLYLVHSKSPTCTWQGPVLQLGLGTSTHLYRGDQGGRQCP